MPANEPRQIVLTGASRGLGLAMAECFISAGHVVHGSARTAAQMAELARRFGPPHTFAAVDVRIDEQVEAWAARVLAAAGPPDLVLNNAALINANAPLWQVAAEEFSAVLDVNVKGTYHVLRHFLPAMIERGRGVIVNFSSGWGRGTSPEVAPYCASKWAIEGLTRALAEELPPGMAAIPINPGMIDTDMLRSCFGAMADSYPDPAAWAERAVPFLLSLGVEHNGEPLTVPG